MGVLVVVTPPAPLVSLVSAKAHLRVTTTDEDVLIGSYISAASAYIDGPNGVLKRAVMAQVLEYRSHVFPGSDFLPCGPVSAIESIDYTDADGVQRSVVESAYEVFGDRLSLTYGSAWPRHRSDPNGVRVRYRAGEAVAPAPIQHAALLLVGQWFRNRMAVNVGNIVNQMPNGVAALLSPYKIRKF